MKKYALYIRTATTDTDEVLTQQHCLTAYVKRQPGAVVKVMLMDVGHSGLKHDRAGLTELSAGSSGATSTRSSSLTRTGCLGM